MAINAEDEELNKALDADPIAFERERSEREYCEADDCDAPEADAND
jgi:hypothetical protein